MDAATREAVTAAAVRAAKAVNYVGAGTIEFIADGTEGLRADRIWFMEMNTRLQVEHPVTEAITGVDLVEWQFRAAAGEPVPLRQDQLSITGWAMEARLYAEDPANGFLPSIGQLDHFVLPNGVRIDTGVEQGGEVSQFYDPMIAKLIVHAETREAAAERLAEACGSVEVWPVRTNAGFLVRSLEHPRFVAGDVDTGLIGSEMDVLARVPSPSGYAQASALTHLGIMAQGVEWPSPWTTLDNIGFRLNQPRQRDIRLVLNGSPVVASYPEDVELAFISNPVVDGDRWIYFERGDVHAFEWPKFSASAVAGTASDGSLRAPMPGKIVATPAKAGDAVTKGQPVVVLEAMKMEHALVAPFDGVVGEVGVSVGDQVAADAVLAVVDANS
ncbi:MAG: hypothetical protein B7Z42_16495 [Brevundimonas sp. 12-68-7]|nr:MAG: hypothetical protein B7Z42_16495 [Brevundimonas sp. 12-68-7]